MSKISSQNEKRIINNKKTRVRSKNKKKTIETPQKLDDIDISGKNNTIETSKKSDNISISGKNNIIDDSQYEEIKENILDDLNENDNNDQFKTFSEKNYDSSVKELSEQLKVSFVEEYMNKFLEDIKADMEKNLIDKLIPEIINKCYDRSTYERTVIKLNDDVSKNGDILPYTIALELLNEIMKLLNRPNIEDIINFTATRDELNSIDGVEFLNKFYDKLSKLGINKQYLVCSLRNSNYYSIHLVRLIIEYNKYYKMVTVRKNIPIEDGKRRLISIYKVDYS